LVPPSLLLFGYALLLAIEFALMYALGRNGTDGHPSGAGAVRAWRGELLTTPRVFCWDQPFRANRWPDQLPTQTGRTPGVLLVHGYVCNRGIWNRWLAELTRQGVPFVALSLEPVFASIENYAQQIDAAIRQLEACTSQPVVVVAHSMGGLAVRHWWSVHQQAPSGATNTLRLKRLITVGSPHRGTWLARFAFSANAREMRIGSEWLAALEAREPEAHRCATTCFFSRHDNIVFPAHNATLDTADNRELAEVAHVEMVDHPAPWAELMQQLSVTGKAQEQHHHAP
jgi:pimeloyl-ACP methyl ester carboxylesterase